MAWLERRQKNIVFSKGPDGSQDGRLIKYTFQMPTGLVGSEPRQFYVYSPWKCYPRDAPQAKYNKIPNFPCVFLFHGTNQDAINSSLYSQKGRKQSWQELADEKQIILVFGESKSWPVPYWQEKTEAVWQPYDISYVKVIFEHVKTQYFIDEARVYGVGHSNGGLFISELVTSCPHMFGAVANHMGGLEVLKDEALEVQTQQIASVPRKTPMLIFTSNIEDNRRYCYNAKKTFEENGYAVDFKEIGHVVHGYVDERTKILWEYLSTQKNETKEVADEPVAENNEEVQAPTGDGEAADDTATTEAEVKEQADAPAQDASNDEGDDVPTEDTESDLVVEQ